EQRGLEGCLAAREEFRQDSARKQIARRLYAKARKQRMTVERTFFGKEHETEPSRIVIDHAGSAAIGTLKVKHHMIMRTQLGTLVMELAGRIATLIRLDAKRPRHAQMADDGKAVIKMDREIFCAAPERRNAPARKTLGKTVWKGKAQVRAALFDLADGRAFHDGLQTTA